MPASRAPRATPITGERPYHLGDLRRTLLEEGWAATIESGGKDIGLREIARRAGVSPTASFHHFRNKKRSLLQWRSRASRGSPQLCVGASSPLTIRPRGCGLYCALILSSQLSTPPCSSECLVPFSRRRTNILTCERRRWRPSRSFDQP